MKDKVFLIGIYHFFIIALFYDIIYISWQVNILNPVYLPENLMPTPCTRL
jgi:hypothetical protein